jgi:hypothetical protein
MLVSIFKSFPREHAVLYRFILQFDHNDPGSYLNQMRWAKCNIISSSESSWLLSHYRHFECFVDLTLTRLNSLFLIEGHDRFEVAGDSET